jgi:hypothetical protein
MDLGIADHGERAGCEQAAQIAIALFADTAKLVLAPVSAKGLGCVKTRRRSIAIEEVIRPRPV